MNFPKVKFPKMNIQWGQFRGRKGNFLLLILIGALLVLVAKFAFLPLLDSQRQVQEELVQKKRVLSRYQEYIKSGKEIEEELKQVAQQAETVQSKLLPGETPQIIAASLQEILKKLSEKNGIQIRSFRIGEPKETPFYLKIPVTIEINPTRAMASLTYFLYDIENYEKFLLISDLDVTAPNLRNPTEVQGSLTVTGFTRNTHPKGKGKEG